MSNEKKGFTDLSLKHLINKIKSTFVNKEDAVSTSTIDVDTTPTENSENLVNSGGVFTALGNKADKGTTVKDITSTSITLTAHGGHSYIYGTLTTLDLSFTSDTDDAEFHIIFKSGATATTLTVSKTFAAFDNFTPSANAIVEIDGMWYLDKWVVFFKETKVSA